MCIVKLYNMLGKDLLIASNGRVIAGQVDCQLNITQKTLEVCSPVSGEWEEHIPTTLGWSVTVNGLIISPEHADELIDIISARQKLRISFYDPKLRIVRSGYAILTNLGEGASLRELTSQSLEFLGSGALEKVKYKNLDLVMKSQMVVEDRYLEPTSNHPIVQLQTGILLREFELKQPTRVVFETDDIIEIGVLVRGTAEKISAILQQSDSMSLWRRELAHISVSIEEFDRIYRGVLAPGTYCTLVNNEDYETHTLFEGLSLPTE